MVYMYHNFLIHSFADGHSDDFNSRWSKELTWREKAEKENQILTLEFPE